MRVVITTLVVLALPGGLHAATLRVPSQFPTIQSAVDSAASGDTVLVAPGRYPDFQTRQIVGPQSAAVFLADDVTLLSEGGATVTLIDPDFSGTSDINPTRIHAFRLSSATTVQGFTLTGSEGGGGQVDECATIRFVDCVFRDMSVGPAAAGVDASDSGMEFLRCEFRDLVGGHASGIDQYASRLLVDDCVFERCSGACVHHHGNEFRVGETATLTGSRFAASTSYGSNTVVLADLDAGATVEDCVFADNVGTGAALEITGLQFGDWRVAGCAFLRNRVPNSSAAALGIRADRGLVENNTFVGNQTAPGGCAVGIRTDWNEIRNNIIARTEGGAAFYGYDRASRYSGCNVIWENEGGVGGHPLAPTDQQVDPLFCDGPGRSIRLAGDSPCLPGNNFGLCGAIGAAGQGCGGNGRVVSLLLTEPPGGPTVFVDDPSVPLTTPSLLVWRPGTAHELTLPDSQQVSAGERYVFTGWEDGSPDTTRTVVAPTAPTTYVASVDSIFTLTMTATAGGTTAPTPGVHWIPHETIVPISAAADSGWFFVSWTGVGPAGTYSGTVADTTVRVILPIAQIATFSRNEDVTIATTPPGLVVIVDGTDHVSPATFAWGRGTLHTVETDSIQAESGGSRLRYDRWSDGRGRAHTITVPNGPLTVTASFLTEHELTFSVNGQGTVAPGDTWWEAGEVVAIEAFPDPYYVFDSWIGAGNGSFSGPMNPASVTMNGPVQQAADLTRISHELSLSLSVTDPDVHTGTPVGFGMVYLWLKCSTSGGLQSLEADLAGSIPIVGFTAAAGVFNTGTSTSLGLVLANCGVGPKLLGTVAVADFSGGDLCVAPSSNTGDLLLTSCAADGSLAYLWPADVGVRGLRTDGAPPCSSGRACGEDEVGAVPSAVPPLAAAAAAALPTATRLDTPRPNPFGDGTEIRFALAEPTRVDLSVYDVRGRLVRRLRDTMVPAGFHGIRWNGTDSEGRRLPAGVYFARLVAGDVRQTRKLILVRR